MERNAIKSSVMHSFYVLGSGAPRRRAVVPARALFAWARSVALATAIGVAAPLPIRAQDQADDPPAGPAVAAQVEADPLRVGTIEWTLAGAAGWGLPVFGYGVDNAFAFPSISVARVLTRPAGRGVLRGQFEWGIELIPFFAQYDPEGAYGLGISPLVWRWNLVPRSGLMPFAELGGGVLWTNVDLPDDTTRANYTAHVTLGVRLLGTRARGALLGYRFEHISNGNRAATNPSVNGHAIVVGWSLFRTR